MLGINILQKKLSLKDKARKDIFGFEIKSFDREDNSKLIKSNEVKLFNSAFIAGTDGAGKTSLIFEKFLEPALSRGEPFLYVSDLNGTKESFHCFIDLYEKYKNTFKFVVIDFSITNFCKLINLMKR